MAKTVEGPVCVKMLLPLATGMDWEDAKPRKDDPRRTDRDAASMMAPIGQTGRVTWVLPAAVVVGPHMTYSCITISQKSHCRLLMAITHFV